MATGRAILITTICSALGSAGCSTHYMPRRGPHLSTIVQGGSLTYVRDGQEFPHGFAGGGLVDAVSNDPEAKDAADTYYSRNVSGFVLYGVGLVGVVGGTIALGASAAQDHPGTTGPTSTQYLGAGAALLGLGAMIAGTVLLATAQPYQFDAINIYNDDVDERLRALPPRGYVYPPPGYRSPPGDRLPPGPAEPPSSKLPASRAPSSAPNAAPAPTSRPGAAPNPAASGAPPSASSAPLPAPPPAPEDEQ